MHEGYKPTKHDWPDDFKYENGNYQNTCCHCGVEFIGHKRRPSCRFCVSTQASPPKESI